jgi:hypothetical protein
MDHINWCIWFACRGGPTSSAGEQAEACGAVRVRHNRSAYMQVQLVSIAITHLTCTAHSAHLQNTHPHSIRHTARTC